MTDEELAVNWIRSQGWSECAKGIHFFINRQEAIDY